MLNHTTASLNATGGELQPDIYRVFQHQPAVESDEYRECCSDLLRVYADHEASLIEVAAIMITALSRIYALIVQSRLDLECSNDVSLFTCVVLTTVGITAEHPRTFDQHLPVVRRSDLHR